MNSKEGRVIRKEAALQQASLLRRSITYRWRLLPSDAVGPYARALYEEGTSTSYFSLEVQTKPVFNVNTLAMVRSTEKLTCQKLSLASRRQHATVEVAVDEAGGGQQVHDDRTSTSRESKFSGSPSSTALLLLLLVICNVTPVDAQGQSGEVQHPQNSRKLNRTRRRLEREIQQLIQRADLSKEDKGRRLERLRSQLMHYQRAKVDPPAETSICQKREEESGGCVRQEKAKYQALFSSPIWSGPIDYTGPWGDEKQHMRDEEKDGHSSNRRNRNRIRRHLRTKIHRMERRSDLSDERRRAETEHLRSQLNRYQRPPRPKKEFTDRLRRERTSERKSSRVENGKRRKVQTERRYGDGLIVHYPIHRVMSGRRHGVWSDGTKYKGLHMKHQRDYMNRATPVKRDYLGYFKAYTQLILQESWVTQAHPRARRGLLSETFREEEAGQTSTSAWEPAPPFEGMIFDIGSSGALPSSRLSTGYQMELLHLDSGFYISVPKDVPLVRPPGENEQHTASQLEEEEVSQDKHA